MKLCLVSPENFGDTNVTTTQVGTIAVSSWLKKRLDKLQEKEIIKAHAYGLYVRVRKTGAIFLYSNTDTMDQEIS